jgi:hypothetical protein
MRSGPEDLIGGKGTGNEDSVCTLEQVVRIDAREVMEGDVVWDLEPMSKFQKGIGKIGISVVVDPGDADLAENFDEHVESTGIFDRYVQSFIRRQARKD